MSLVLDLTRLFYHTQQWCYLIPSSPLFLKAGFSQFLRTFTPLFSPLQKLYSWIRWILLTAVVCGSSTSQGLANDQTNVDVELILAVDISFSISSGEQDIQRQGYVAAFRDPKIIRSITSGRHGRIAVTYLEWAGPDLRRQIIPWTEISDTKSALAFADALKSAKIHRGGRTSISAALAAAHYLFSINQFQGTRRIVDISGDGPNNFGGPVALARDRLVSQGVTINGLPLTGSAGSTEVPINITHYYSECVIGGPGAFIISVSDWKDFQLSLKRKLILEIAGNRPLVLHAAAPIETCQGLYS